MYYRNNCFTIYGTLKKRIDKGDFEYLMIDTNKCNVLVKNKNKEKSADLLKAIEENKEKPAYFNVKAYAFDKKIYYELEV